MTCILDSCSEVGRCAAGASRPSTHAPRWRAARDSSRLPRGLATCTRSLLSRPALVAGAEARCRSPRRRPQNRGRMRYGLRAALVFRGDYDAGAELSSSKPSFLTAASTLPPLDSAMSTHAHEYPCIEHSPGQDPLCPPLFQGSRSLGARERRIRPAIEKDSSATHTAGVRPCPSPSPPRPAAPMRAHAVRSGEPRLRVAARLHPLLIPLVTALCAQELSVCTRDGSGRLGSPRRYYALRLSPLPLVLAGTGGCAHAAHCHCGSQHGHDAAGAEVLGVAAASRP